MTYLHVHVHVHMHSHTCTCVRTLFISFTLYMYFFLQLQRVSIAYVSILAFDDFYEVKSMRGVYISTVVESGTTRLLHFP